MRRILVTGSRTWKDRETIVQALQEAVRELGGAWVHGEPVTLVHGDCPTGADAIADYTWRVSAAGLPVERHPANWQKLGRRAGYLRNAEMVKSGANVCLAFIKDGSTGASMTADMAEKAGIPTRRFAE